MSSHHIVRDEQEPALVIWHPGQLSFSQAGELLGWSPQVVVHTQAAAEVLGWGIKVDALCGTHEELEQTLPDFDHQYPLQTIELEKAYKVEHIFEWLRQHKQQAVNIALLPYSQANSIWQKCAEATGLQLGVLSDGFQYFWVEREVSKWLPAGTHYALLNPQSSFETELCTTSQSGMLEIKHPNPFWVGWAI